jgi:hypothetical protein
VRGIEGCEVVSDHKPETIARAIERTLLRGGRIKGRQSITHLDEKVLAEKLVGIYRSVLLSSRSNQRTLARVLQS